MECVVENSRKSLLKTLVKLSFWFGNIGSKTCGEDHWNSYAWLVKKLSSNLVENNPREPQFIGIQKLAVGVQISSSCCCWSTTRSTANGRFFDRWEGRSTARSTAFRAMARRSTARSTGPFSESRTLWRSTVRSTGPGRARFVHVGRRPGQPTSGSVDRAIERQKAKNSIFTDLKVVFLHLIKSHKSTKNLQK